MVWIGVWMGVNVVMKEYKAVVSEDYQEKKCTAVCVARETRYSLRILSTAFHYLHVTAQEEN